MERGAAVREVPVVGQGAEGDGAALLASGLKRLSKRDRALLQALELAGALVPEKAQALLGARAVRGAPAGRFTLTDRDRELLGHLATARYLSTEQVAALAFTGRDSATRERRLLALAALGKDRAPSAFLSRTPFRTFEADRHVAWSLTAAGYRIASRVLGRDIKPPRGDVKPQFLAHQVALSELYVELVAPERRMCPRCRAAGRVGVPLALAGDKAKQLDLRLACGWHDEGTGEVCDYASPDVDAVPARVEWFRWVTSENTRLPWRDFDAETMEERARALEPDALLELPAQQRRLFIECEMGSQPLTGAEDRRGATISKATSYMRYFERKADAARGLTFYAERFPDRWQPEVLFLVQSAQRRGAALEALQGWAASQRRALDELPVRVLMLEEAAAYVRALAKRSISQRGAPGGVSGEGRGASWTAAELELLRGFFSESVATLKAIRHHVRQGRGALPKEPPYPASVEAVQALLEQKRKAVGAR